MSWIRTALKNCTNINSVLTIYYLFCSNILSYYQGPEPNGARRLF